ncbi:MAG: beta-mannosidase [Planctomycetota bacterium]|jgi:beta-mannosidase
MGKVSFDLTGQWEFKEYPLTARRMRDLDSGNWLGTTVPCSIFESLIGAGQIDRSKLNAFPERFSQVSEKPWIYRKSFDAPAELLDCDRVDLVFDGLDTIASVWLNDKLIGKTNNMFIRFRFDVTRYLKEQNNSLLVKFDSATKYAKRLMKRYTSFSESDFINPSRVYIRKAQYQFGWDFCPALPGCGIWRGVRLEGVIKAGFADVHIRTIHCNQNYADIKIAVELDTVTREKFLCNLSIGDDKETIEQEVVFNPGENSHSTLIRIENPSLWWPRGYGKQSLYQVNAQLLSDSEIIDQIQKKFGIRTVKLHRRSGKVRHRDKQTSGGKFQFVINGQPVFATGSNWIPISIFAGSVTAGDYEELLGAAAKANINMLRVWGGGYYEAKEFYELCDELGIMVWQDFMFACAYYPDRGWFLKQVKTECSAIIKQLRNHPSLVLWCGNNEIDWLHNTGKLGPGKKFYGKAIYHRVLPQLVTELAPDFDYIPTTPLGEKNEFEIGRTLTTHQWEVWSGHQPVRQYLCEPQEVPPFVTEFGLQSLPDIETVKDFCQPEQLHVAGEFVEKHNYQLDGNSRLYRYTSDLFGPAENLEQFIYLSQITQARAVKTYVEHLRAYNFRNNGVLFWQFNDCCPAISWSAVDYTQKPKALYYYAKHFFSKLLATVVPEFEKSSSSLPPKVQMLSVIVINDDHQPVTATLHCRLVDLFSQPLDQVAYPIAIAPFSTSSKIKLPKAIALPSHPEKTALHLLIEKDGKKIVENTFFYLPDKHIVWPKAKITSQFSKITDGQCRLKLKSDAIAKDVQVYLSGAEGVIKFSDNFIDLIGPDEIEVKINSARPICSFESGLQMRSINSVFARSAVDSSN